MRRGRAAAGGTEESAKERGRSFGDAARAGIAEDCGEITGRLLWRAKLNSGKSDNHALAPRTDGVQVGQVLADPIENAIDLWAEASTRAETRDREERLRDKKHIVRSFLDYVSKHPGEVDPADVRAWRKHLESLKSENTVYSLSLIHI